MGTRKWAKVKRQKQKDDQQRSQKWAKLSQEIETAAREGGGDPDANVPLSQAIERARDVDMPKDNIQRAIKRGTGELEGEDVEALTYEGYAPHGVAVFVEAETDNRNRTVKDLRNLLSDYGGNLGKDGAVAYLFDRKGRFEIPADATDEMTLFETVVEAGADEVTETDDTFVVTTPAAAFADVEAALDAAGIAPDTAELVRLPSTTVALPPDKREEVEALIEQIDDHNDVAAVYTTLDSTTSA
ncbi:MAG: YebC/PmpR family DNA-binding transcriptional regulator [Salinibacter sp.]